MRRNRTLTFFSEGMRGLQKGAEAREERRGRKWESDVGGRGRGGQMAKRGVTKYGNDVRTIAGNGRGIKKRRRRKGGGGEKKEN